MSRNGSGVYSKPAGTTFVPNTVIESSRVNEVIDDIAADLNLARPIVAGGTGATSAGAARTALGVPGLAGANTFTGIQKWAKGADVASATALTLGDDGNYFDITGTTAITSIATKGVGTRVLLQFDGVLTLTHNATDLVLLNGANITTAAGDHAEFVEYASGDWRCVDYTRVSNSLATVSLEDIKWVSKAIGEFYWADDGVTGVDIPPSSTSGSTVWVELTSGLTGSGQFNENKLTSESVTGTAPLVQATAVVSLTGSPMDGQTIRLINTERRFLRAGSAGTVEADAMQGHLHDANYQIENTGGAGAVARAVSGSRDTGVPKSDGSNGTPRTANETRGKNIGVRVFRRIK